MKLKTTIIASALLSLTALFAHAAQELTPEKAAALKPFDRITITGRFNAINEAVDAVSRRADKLGADSFYIRDSNNSNNGGNWRVTADLYHKDAPEVSKTPKYRVFNGVNELPKDEAYLLEPYDTVSVSGFYRSQPDINDAISKEAKKKVLHPSSSCAVDANSGGNQFVTAYIYKADAPKRRVQSPDAIPADSDAGRAALAAGGAAAAKVEIPGVASSGSPPRRGPFLRNPVLYRPTLYRHAA